MAGKKAVVFGTGGFAEVVSVLLSRDSDYEVTGFTATSDSISADEVFGKPLVSFEAVVQTFPPQEHDLFIAIGYTKLNQLRARFCGEARAKGYHLLSYISSKCTYWGEEIGDNVFIFEDNTIQPFVSIGNGTILWSGNHIGHHSSIGEYCFITSHVVVSGYCKIGSYSFVGVNATISDDTKIGQSNLIGPGTLIQKDTKDNEAYVAERTKKFPKDSSIFFK
jgi:sugar O-acyltransferase (sialic acid O-acetyltransferase NeuD family)